MSIYCRHPSIYNEEIFFCAQEMLWKVEKNGFAYPIVTQIKCGRNAAIKNKIAFNGEFNECNNIYLLENEEITQLTFTNSGFLVDWLDEETLAFASSHQSHKRGLLSLYTVNIQNKEVKELPYEIGVKWISKNANTTVVQKNGYGYTNWKKYKGGAAAQIWIQKGERQDFERILADCPYNKLRPTLYNDRIYFLSDHKDRGNVYSCDLKGENLKQHSYQKEFYAHEMRMDKDNIVYCAGGDLWKINLKKNQEEKIKIKKSNFSAPQIKNLNPRKYLKQISLSTEGRNVTFNSRGKIYHMPTRFGSPTEIHSSERKYAHSWLNKRDFCFIKRTFQKESVCFCNSETNEVFSEFVNEYPKINKIKSNANYVVFTNHKGEIVSYSIEQKTFCKIDKGKFDPIMEFDLYDEIVVYSVYISHEISVIKIYDLKKNEGQQITKPLGVDFCPQIDANKKYVYFLGKREIFAEWDNIAPNVSLNGDIKLYLILLQEEISPFEKEPSEKPSEKEEIELANILNRCIPFPKQNGIFKKIFGLKNKLIWQKEEEKESFVFNWDKLTCESIGEMTNIQISPCKKHMLYIKDKKLKLIEAGEKPGDGQSYKDEEIPVESLTLDIDEKDEREKMLEESWELQKDFFWNESININWDKIYEKYRSLLNKIHTKRELYYLINELAGELQTSHAYILETNDNKPSQVGYLGGEIEFDHKKEKYYVKDILPSEKITPLRMPGAKIKVGDILENINGKSLTQKGDLEKALFYGKNQKIKITFSNQENQKVSYHAQTINSEEELRYIKWFQENDQKVKIATNDQVGYIHIPDMVNYGYSKFYSEYRKKHLKQGLIIDVRFNSGGNMSQAIVKILSQRILAFGKGKWEEKYSKYPADAPNGPMVFLINGRTASDGDIFAYAVKKLALGPLIGTKTWGGIIGICPRYPLLDNSLTSQPEYSFIAIDEKPIENAGIEPDIKCENSLYNTNDKQLEKGIETINRLISEFKYVKKTLGQ